MTTFMATLPQSLIGQLFLILWLIACVAVLVFGFKERKHHEKDFDITVIVYCLMMILTFPLGWVAAPLLGLAISVIGISFEHYYPNYLDRFSRYDNGFVSTLVLWLFFVAVGCFQWLIVIPWLYNYIIKNIFIFS